MDLDKISVYKKRGSTMKKSKKILITVAVILIAVYTVLDLILMKSAHQIL